MDPWRTLGSGDQLPRSAAGHNAMMRAAKEARNHDTDQLAELVRRTRQATVVQVRNISADPVERFGILGIDGPTFAPIDNEAEYLKRVHLKGTAPTAAHLGSFVILLDPLAPGAIGRGIIAGITVCKVEFPEPGLRFADLNLTNPDNAPLIAQGYGPVQILAVDEIPPLDGGEADSGFSGEIDGGEADTEEFHGEVDAGGVEQTVFWCIVRIGNDTRGVSFKVLCTIDGGSAGTLGISTCSWTYTVTTLDGVLLGEGLTPVKPRWVNTPYTSTPAGMLGEGFYDIDGEFILAEVYETQSTQGCETPGGGG